MEELLPLVGEDTPVNDPSAMELAIMSDYAVAYEKEHFPLGCTPSLRRTGDCPGPDVGPISGWAVTPQPIVPPTHCDTFRPRAHKGPI